MDDSESRRRGGVMSASISSLLGPERPAVRTRELERWRTRARHALLGCARLKNVRHLIEQADGGPSRAATLHTLMGLVQLGETIERWSIPYADVHVCPLGIVLWRLSPDTGTVYHYGPAIMAWQVLIKLGVVAYDHALWFQQLGHDGEVIRLTSRRELP